MAWTEWGESGGEETGQEVRKDAGAAGTGPPALCPARGEASRVADCSGELAGWVWKAEDPGQLPSLEATELGGVHEPRWGLMFQPQFLNL